MSRYRFSRRGIHHAGSVDASRFIRGLLLSYSIPKLADLCGVSWSTVHRWKEGTAWPTAEVLHRLIDRLFPQSEGSGPVYSPDIALDGNTRVGGVGEYTIRAARGEIMTSDETE